MAENNYKIVIIGGGAAGITVAASLLRHNAGKQFDITVIDPASEHYYQPAFTLVGGGCFNFEKTKRSMKSLIPKGAKWLQEAATNINPEDNTVSLSNNTDIEYDYLVVCPGLALDWSATEGLAETIGKNGVCSNYSPDYVQYTWECLQKIKSGDTLFFCQPPLPFKCPGAPQKIAYLSADYLKQKKLLESCDLHFATSGPKMFGLDYFAISLAKVADRYGIEKNFHHHLIKVDGDCKTATFELMGGDNQGEIVEFTFDMLHATPVQRTPAFLHNTDLINEAGYVEVHQNSLQQLKYPNIFGLGDVTTTPNSKSAAAVRKQSPTVVQNIKNMIDGKAVEESYNGYGSCPLTTSRSTVMMAEFMYGGVITPTMPYIAKPRVESKLMWRAKKFGLPILYWDYMLKGYEKFFEPKLNYKD